MLDIETRYKRGVTLRFSVGGVMESLDLNKFRENLKSFVEHIITEHIPLKVATRSGEDFTVLSADDWEQEQETLFVLQNNID